MTRTDLVQHRGGAGDDAAGVDGRGEHAEGARTAAQPEAQKPSAIICGA